MRRHRTRRALVLFALALAGCAKHPEPLPVEATDTVIRLGNVCQWYTRFVTKNGRPPKNDPEFQEFVKKLPAIDMPIGPDAVAEYLVSPRDKEPFVIRFTPLAGDDPVIAYERTGVSGQRFVVRAETSRTQLVDEAKFKELVPDAR